MSTRTTTPRPLRLGGWPAAVALVPLTALIFTATPALGADEPTPEPTATATATATASPTPTTDPTSTGPAPSETPTSTPLPTSSPTPAPAESTTTFLIGAGLSGGPAALAMLSDPGTPPQYLPAGTPASAVAPFQTLRVAVQLRNGGTDAVTVSPRLEFHLAGTTDFQTIPEAAEPGVALHAAEEWVATDTGSTPAPATALVSVEELKLPIPEGLTPVPGQRSSGVNPVSAYFIAPGTVSEQEFTVAVSIDAAYGATYELRVTNAGEPISGLSPVQVSMGAEPDTVLSPGQLDGVDPSTDTSGVTYPLVGSRTVSATATDYPLFTALATAEATPTTVSVSDPGTIHEPGAGQCGTCHQTHSARAKTLIRATSETDQCYTCHAGGVGGADVRAQYTLGQPENNPETRSYYSHDPTQTSEHVLDSRNEFMGKLTRHSQCSDCHDPHGAKTDKAVMTPTGWTAPGSFAKASGVAVTNGAAGTVPTYTWLDGLVQPLTAEYQLCFKCHTSFTALPEAVPDKPSQRSTDLATDFNPANLSYHPIEAPGRNQTQKLADSLAGSSPYKLWNFTVGDTIRCVSCHASNTTGTSTDPAKNAPDANLTVHASTNRGILTRPYENRVLSEAGTFYDAKGAALCLTCHMETPFMNRLRPAAADGTNFVFHGLHMSGITTKGSGGLDIDTPGAGQGNARCAECHFSNHGTTQPPSPQNVSGDRLVTFAPNVLPSKAMGGVPKFVKTDTGGNCTLTCHGKDHQGARYSY